MANFNMETYRPLPEGLTIKQSKIDGLGLHALKSFEAGTVFGETHVLVHSRDRHEWIRTPLGGFINHSANPNAVIIMCDTRHERKLYTIRPIEAGEEISIYYTLYYPYHKEHE